MKKYIFIISLLSTCLSFSQSISMGPAKLDISHFYTDDFSLEITVRDDAGDPIDLTGYTGQILIKKDETSSANLKDFDVSFADSVIVIAIDADSLTSLKAPKSFIYLLQINDGASLKTWLSGNFNYTVRPNASQISSLILAFNETDLEVTVNGVTIGYNAIADSLVRIDSSLADHKDAIDSLAIDVNAKLNSVDTLSLSNRINTKFDKSDTTDYYKDLYIDALLTYKIDKADTILYYKRLYTDALLANKLNYADTTNSIAMQWELDGKLIPSDSLDQRTFSDLKYSLKAGSTSIITLGTVTTGTWNAGAITSSGAIKGTTLEPTGLGTGYLPYKTATTLSNSPIYTDGTSVGINTIPDTKLHVLGTAGAPATSGTVSTAISRIATTTGTTLDVGGYSSPPYGLWLQGADWTNLTVTYPIILNPNGGNVGIDTTTPGTWKLNVNGDVYVADTLKVNGNAMVVGSLIFGSKSGGSSVALDSVLTDGNDRDTLFLYQNGKRYVMQEGGFAWLYMLLFGVCVFNFRKFFKH